MGMRVDIVTPVSYTHLRVQNAVPLMSFDNAMPTYQVLKSLLKKDPDLSLSLIHIWIPPARRLKPRLPLRMVPPRWIWSSTSAA